MQNLNIKYEIKELYEKNKKIICIDIDNTICKTF